MAGSTKLGAYVQWEAVNSSGTVTTTSSALSYTEGASGGSSPPQTNDGWSQTIASWPQDWYPSGSQNFINDGRTHGIECNGNVFQDTQGGWWVHLYARDRDDIYTNAERQKAWTGSWLGSGAGGVVAQPLNTDTDNGVTVALPALASMPSWGWAATFHQRVQLPTGVQGTTPSNQTDPSDGLWANDAGGNPWHWLSVKNVNVATVGGGTTVSIASPAAAAAYWGAAGPFLGSFNGTSWLLNHFAGGHSADPVSLGPAAKAWAAKGIRYQNSAGTQVGAAAPYSEYEILCTVWVNPTASEPDAGGPGNQTTINVYPSDSPGGAESKTHDPCSSGISVPVVGWLIDSFKGLACAIGSFFGDLLQGLLDMFGPPDISFESFLDTAGINFPFNIITGLTTTTESIISTLTGGEIDQDASGCFDPDVNSILESATRPGMTSTPTWDVHLPLPAPSSAGCNMYAAGTGMGAVADSIGDVFGYRLALRGLFVLVLYVSFGTAIVRAAIEKDDAEDDLS
jgi:hypothetical protein